MKRHKSWMMVICIIPLVLLVAFYFFGFASSYLRWGVLFLCLFMMLFMMLEKDHCATNEKNTEKMNTKGRGKKCH